MKCEACRSDSWNEGHYPETLLLLGLIAYRLCTECRRDWGPFVQDTAVFAHRVRVEARSFALAGRAMAGDAPSEDEWLALGEDGSTIRAELEPVIDQWLEKRIRDSSAKDG